MRLISQYEAVVWHHQQTKTLICPHKTKQFETGLIIKSCQRYQYQAGWNVAQGILGTSWATLELLWAIFEAFWTLLRLLAPSWTASWGHLGLCWLCFGSFWKHLEPSWAILWLFGLSLAIVGLSTILRPQEFAIFPAYFLLNCIILWTSGFRSFLPFGLVRQAANWIAPHPPPLARGKNIFIGNMKIIELSNMTSFLLNL